MWAGNHPSSSNRDDGSMTSPASKVACALKQTPKGRLVYDRDPKSPPPLVAKSDTSLLSGPNFTSARSPNSPTGTSKHDDSLGSDTDLPIRDYSEEKSINHGLKSVLHSSSNRNVRHNTSDEDDELCKRLRKLWSVDDRQAIVILERLSLLEMENMRVKGQRVDSALTLMELRRKERVRHKVTEKTRQMTRKSQEFQKEAMQAFSKNLEKLHQQEEILKEEEERAALEMQKKLNEDRARQREEKRLSQEQRQHKLQQIAAAQQQQQRQRQEEEAKLLADEERNRKAAEEHVKRMEERRREVIRFATQAYSRYNEVRPQPEKDDCLNPQDADKVLMDNLKVPFESLSSTLLTEGMTRLASASDIQIVEQEAAKVEEVSKLFIQAADLLDVARKSAKEARDKKEAEVKLAEQSIATNQVISLQEQSNMEPNIVHPVVLEHSKTNQLITHTHGSPANLERYSQLKTFKLAWVARIQPIEHDKGSPIKFSLQKGVNTPVNAIAATSSEHMKDKLNKLRQLLSGDIGIQGVDELELARDFAKNLLAAKFVKQGEVEVSNKKVSDEGFQGFAYAAIISALWADHPDFGQLFLAHTYEACRYLIPSIPGALPVSPTRQDYEARGYKYEDDGSIEKQDQFVNRIGGVARLLACVAVSQLPMGEQGKEHPFGLGNIWQWFSSTLNLTPVNDVTSTLLYDILEITAAQMFEKYNQRFIALLHLLHQQYLPRIRHVTNDGSGGPIERLEQFLKKIIENPLGIKPPSSSRLKSGVDFL